MVMGIIALESMVMNNCTGVNGYGNNCTGVNMVMGIIALESIWLWE